MHLTNSFPLSSASLRFDYCYGENIIVMMLTVCRWLHYFVVSLTTLATLFSGAPRFVCICLPVDRKLTVRFEDISPRCCCCRHWDNMGSSAPVSQRAYHSGTVSYSLSCEQCCAPLQHPAEQSEPRPPDPRSSVCLKMVVSGDAITLRTKPTTATSLTVTLAWSNPSPPHISDLLHCLLNIPAHGHLTSWERIVLICSFRL